MAFAFKGTGKQFYMDRFHKSNLDIAKKVILKDWDMVFIYDGAEGSGKSVKAMQDATYCDPTLNLDRICFTPKEFKDAILTAKKYEAVIYDEAYSGLSARATMSRINRSLVAMLAEIRQKNLFVFVVMPTYFDLDKYVALWRSRALIHVFTGKNFQRGFFAFYDVDRKKNLYIQGKKFYSYSQKHAKPNYIGKFVNHHTVDETEYKKKKLKSLTRRLDEEEQAELRKEVMAELVERVLSIGDVVTHKVKMLILDLAPATYYRRLREFKDNEEGKTPPQGIDHSIRPNN